MPADQVQHLTLDEVLAIHTELITRFGGISGIRDPGLLESALYRPQSGYYDDLAEMAAALFESLIMNHPFANDNKRVAFFATDVFLRLNGWKMNLNDEEAYDFLMELFKGNACSFDRLLPWIRSSLVCLD